MTTDFQSRLKQHYLKNKYLYSNISLIDNFIDIDSHTSVDVSILRSGLVNIRDSYENSNISLYCAVDELCKIIDLYDTNVLNSMVYSDYITISDVENNYAKIIDFNNELSAYSKSSDLSSYYYETLNNMEGIYAAPSYVNDALDLYVTEDSISSYAQASFVGSSTVADVSSSDDNTITGAIGDTVIKIGTLRSFYSCTGSSGTSKTLITVGNDTLSGKIKNIMDCINYANSFISNSDFLNNALVSQQSVGTRSGSNIYYSNFEDGGCSSLGTGPNVDKIGLIFNLCLYNTDH